MSQDTTTENPPYAAGADLVPDAAAAAGPALPVTSNQVTVVTTENPPSDHGHLVVSDDASQPADAEAADRAVEQSSGLHAADVPGLEERQVG